MKKFLGWYCNSIRAQFWFSFGAGTFGLLFPVLVVGRPPHTLTWVISLLNYAIAAYFGYKWLQERRGTEQKS